MSLLYEPGLGTSASAACRVVRHSRVLLLAIVAALPGCNSASGPSGLEAAERERLRAESERFAGASATRLVENPAAIALAGRLFAADCATCHGVDARGGRGLPDLTVGDLAYGATPEAVRTTIVQGRTSVMPPMGRKLGEVEVGQIVAYVQSLALGSGERLPDYEQRGRDLFIEHCAECHGTDGLGVRELGTPTLADDHWRHGDSMMSIRLVITRGIESTCPARDTELSTTEAELLTAFVLHLGNARNHTASTAN